MPLPYYVSPEQMMKDKAEYARKGISRGKAIVAIEYRDGVLLVAENPSTLLHKVSEILCRSVEGFSATSRMPSPYSRATMERPREMPLRAYSALSFIICSGLT